MDIQVPAQGILSRNPDHYRWQSFLVECDCTDPDHAINVHVSIDREEADDDFVAVEFYATTWTPYDWHAGWWKTTKIRASRIWQLLTKGVVKVEHCFIMRDQAALNFGAALIAAVEKHQQYLSDVEEAKKTVRRLGRRSDTR